MKYDKIKPSRHYLKNLKDRSREGHDVPLEDAKLVIDEPCEVQVQPENSRTKFWAQPEGYAHPVRAVAEVTASAGVAVCRVITAFIDSGKRFLKADQD